MAPTVALAALTIVKLLIGIVLPIAPLTVIDPAPAVRLKLNPPSTLFKERALPPLLRLTGLERVMGDPNWRPAEPVTFAPNVTAPPPLCVKAPLEEIAPERVAAPVLTREMGPLFVVVRPPVAERVAVERVIPPIVELAIGPEIVVKPETVVEIAPLTLTP
jgi:hypothetical protein